MNFKTPKFWHKRMSVISILLIPVSWLYRILHNINMKRQGPPYNSNTLIICVGNAIAGGSGKTPTVITLINLILNNKIAERPFILTRGYGGTISKPTLVDLDKHSSIEVGDEALLLARYAPTIISPNRADGARFAETQNAELVIMDDGLQNNHLAKNLSFLVVDRQIDFGNNRVLPAGPLREPLSKILPKVQAVICIGRAFHFDKPVFETTVSSKSSFDASKKYIAFAGLGYPEKFKNTLLDLKADLVGWHPFPDHHNYSTQELEDLNDKALSREAVLITTEKDHVRLPSEWKNKVESLPIKLNFNEEQKIIDFLKEKLGSAL